METELNGFAVILEYRLYLKGDKQSLERIFKYNEEDCRATKLIVKLDELLNGRILIETIMGAI